MTIEPGTRHHNWLCLARRPTGSRKQRFRCLSCGREFRVRYDHVQSGRSRCCVHCGRGRPRAHGASGTQLHAAWMRHRGDVAQWQEFESFRRWSLQHGFRDGRWLIRLDASKPHGPDNSRWLDKSQNRIGRASG